jgi:hypothetical protein
MDFLDTEWQDHNYSMLPLPCIVVFTLKNLFNIKKRVTDIFVSSQNCKNYYISIFYSTYVRVGLLKYV